MSEPSGICAAAMCLGRDGGGDRHNQELAHMIRKFAATLLALVFAVGAVFAEEIKGTFVKFADGKLTIKVDDKDKEFKIPADLTQKVKVKGEEKEIKVSDMLSSPKMKEGTKLVVVTDKDEVKSVKREPKAK